MRLVSLCRLLPPNLEPFLGGLASYSIHDREQTIDMAWSFIKCVSTLPIAHSVSVTETAHPAQYSDKYILRTQSVLSVADVCKCRNAYQQNETGKQASPIQSPLGHILVYGAPTESPRKHCNRSLVILGHCSVYQNYFT